MKTLYEIMTADFVHQCRKHDLAPDSAAYADGQLNEYTNAQLVKAISYALIEMDSVRRASPVHPRMTATLGGRAGLIVDADFSAYEQRVVSSTAKIPKRKGISQ